jgi:Ser-tRNA(Ala) deacylase AlaX
VIAKISEQDRLLHAALHTSGHLLNWELSQFGWKAIKGHHFPGESRVEFSPMDSNVLPSEQLPLQKVESSIKMKLHEGRKVTTWFEENDRLCLIEGCTPIPCAGTHVDDLNKIDEFSIKSIKFKKGILRISYDASHIAMV